MTVDLLFSATPVAGSPTALVFGEIDTNVQTPADLVLVGILPAMHAQLRAAQVMGMGLNAQLSALTSGIFRIVPSLDCRLVVQLPGISVNSADATMLYLSRTERPVVNEISAGANSGHPVESGLEHPEHQGLPFNAGIASPFKQAQLAAGTAAMSYKVALAAHIHRTSVFQDASTLRTAMATALWQEASADRRVHTWSPFQEGQRASEVRAVSRFEDGLRDRRAQLESTWAGGTPWILGYCGRAGDAVAMQRLLASAFQDAWVPRPGVYLAPLPPPVVPTYWGTALLFSCPPLAAPMLVFGARQCEIPDVPPTGVVTLAVRKVYFVINDVSLRRASNGVEVPVNSLSLSLDASSWAWGFDAVLPHSAQSLIEPNGSGVVELLATVNGTTFAVLAENISRERSFGQTSIRLTGRGRNAVLAAPYAPVMTFTNSQARTARQLMDDVLTINGVSMGWNVDWGLTDWNVPSGVFAHQGTWIEALSVIAGAAGGYLLPHPRDPTIRVRHRFPVAPWEWATVAPNFVLPVDAVEKESLRWLEKPSYNRVFVSGQEAGVLAQVTRSGTAGDLLAPMVVDALITEAAVARQRGLAVLSDTGRQIEVNLNLPVLLDTGIIEPGAFVQYRDGRVDRLGLVRSTQVNAGFPEVWQTLGVQTYA